MPDAPVAMLPLSRALLYEAWTRLNWPKVESVTGAVDVAHATGLIPCATASPLVVTVHDLAFLHTPDKFTKHGAKLMTRSLDVARQARRSRAVPQRGDDAGLPGDTGSTTADSASSRSASTPRRATARELDDARRRHDLPDDFVLFVGTLEPRKNLRRLVAAMATLAERGRGIPLVVAGAGEWGDVRNAVDRDDRGRAADVRFIGAVSDADLRGLYAAARVFAYPSEREGFGLPVAEAMAQGTAGRHQPGDLDRGGRRRRRGAGRPVRRRRHRPRHRRGARPFVRVGRTVATPGRRDVVETVGVGDPRRLP